MQFAQELQLKQNIKQLVSDLSELHRAMHAYGKTSSKTKRFQKFALPRSPWAKGCFVGEFANCDLNGKRTQKLDVGL